MICVLVCLITTVFGVLVYWLVPKANHGQLLLPPGPRGLPLLGNVLELGNRPHVKLGEWAHEFGNVFMFKLLTQRVVVLTDPDFVREAFNHPNMSGRVELESLNILAGGKFGIIHADGPDWAEQRRFTVRNLRALGFGKSTMESLIEVEVAEYLDFLKKNERSPVSLQRAFSLAVFNALWVILTSRRYNHDDPRLVNLFQQNSKISGEFVNSLAFFVPKVAKLIPKLSGWTKLEGLIRDMQNFATESIKYHQNTFPQDQIPRDFIDSYLLEIKTTTNSKSSFYQKTGEKSLGAVMSDMLIAGGDTTALTLTWAVLYLCKFPQAQEKLHQELDAVVGKNRTPKLSDRPNLPYTEAIILETLRMSSIVPMGLFHRCMADSKLKIYDIPKDTWICANQYNIHYSEELWEQPKIFEPRRFIDGDGKSIKKPEAFMPFSYGKRVCIGENVAKDSAFLFLTSTYQKYRIKLAPESENVSLEPNTGFFLPPKPFNVIIEERL